MNVAVGVIKNSNNQVLISRRLSNVHQAGLWEFPGGKLEAGETVDEALSRELDEELALTVKSARPLIKIHHDYADQSVLLHVLQVDSWDSELLENNANYGRQGQRIEWIDTRKLANRDFPEANKPIIKAVQLPELYLICPEPESDTEIYIEKFKACITAGIRLFQLRFRDDTQYDRHKELITELLDLCTNHHSRLLMNGDPDQAVRYGMHGVHLNSHRLMQLDNRPLDERFLVAASCHDPGELEQASNIQVDFAVLSPVRRTQSHQAVKPMGWHKFRDLVDSFSLPIYALGGMQAEDMRKSWISGGQGISVLGGIWKQANINEALAGYMTG